MTSNMLMTWVGRPPQLLRAGKLRRDGAESQGHHESALHGSLSLDGKRERVLPKLPGEDAVVGWDADGAVFVRRGIAPEVYRSDLATESRRRG